jgi:hypothetical protein
LDLSIQLVRYLPITVLDMPLAYLISSHTGHVNAKITFHQQMDVSGFVQESSSLLFIGLSRISLLFTHLRSTGWQVLLTPRTKQRQNWVVFTSTRSIREAQKSNSNNPQSSKSPIRPPWANSLKISSPNPNLFGDWRVSSWVFSSPRLYGQNEESCRITISLLKLILTDPFASFLSLHERKSQVKRFRWMLSRSRSQMGWVSPETSHSEVWRHMMNEWGNCWLKCKVLVFYFCRFRMW